MSPASPARPSSPPQTILGVSKMMRQSVNGQAASPTTRRASRKPRVKHIPREWAERFRVGMNVSLGVGIPLLSLALSKVAGTLAANSQYALAAFALALMLAVLGVSLSHLAWAV